MSTMQQGLILMVTGMTVVFAFLVILIYVTKFLSFVVRKFFPEKEKPAAVSAPASSSPSPAAAIPAAAGSGNEIAAAIAAAALYGKKK